MNCNGNCVAGFMGFTAYGSNFLQLLALKHGFPVAWDRGFR